jgi:hypothetical protein
MMATQENRTSVLREATRIVAEADLRAASDGTTTQPGTRRTLATFRTYAEAQRAIDSLADQRFPVERSAIAAEGISPVEQVTGRTGYGKVAVMSALTGGLMGAVFGLLFGLFGLITPVASWLVMPVYGFVVGAVIGLISHALSGGRRDFTSVTGIQAERYNILVDDEVAGEAERILGAMP